MKILFITDNFPPEVNAPATRTYEHVQEWIKEGTDVTIITCFPNFPHGKIYAGYKNKLYQKEYIDGIEVIRVWSYITANSGFIKRVLDYVSFAFMAFWVGLFQKYDIIIATSPQFFTTWTGWGLSKIRRKPWIFELRDLWPESIKTVGAMKQGRVIDILEKIELALYRDATRVIAVTDAFKNNLIKRGINAEKIDVITNGSNVELFYDRTKDPLLLEQLNISGKFIIGYIGTHGLAHSLDFIVQSIAKISDPDIHFLFIGDGAMKKTIVALANEFSLTNVTFLDPISKEDVPMYLSICDVSLAPLKKEDNFKTVIPSKIFEASAMRKPTLLGVEGQAKEIIEHHNAGLCFEPENESDFIAKVQQLKNDPILYSSLQLGCDSLAIAYDRKKLAHQMYTIIKQHI
ncbi:MAG: glycosyltransferase family 4 protein [Sulfuricurvum sp.]|uniref:glycosyltransferase family 4 protein n=1 Tax=Sulfuricurvum sp. TaxID=2025608 RepID=UPI0026315C68|nr:glycosyltransferase family 4 protein [Sulfuricurvum sp.]MDD2367669.1 glycosyltransferase family 4 protein [Sulfuricurvum sp.]MDD5118594.1 glycosyltransferase family 4 protein [Sulfuricurvum sp.]